MTYHDAAKVVVRDVLGFEAHGVRVVVREPLIAVRGVHCLAGTVVGRCVALRVWSKQGGNTNGP